MEKILPNVFETIDDAQTRIQGGIVKHSDGFFFVETVRTHKDGIFRLYLSKLPFDRNRDRPLPTEAEDDVEDGVKTKGGSVIRKKINSPKFDCFRPFPLGFCNNENGEVYYVARQPRRRTHQALTLADCINHKVRLSTKEGYDTRGLVVLFGGAEFNEMLEGRYPTFNECCENLSNDDCRNEGAAFDREFCVLKGICGILFLATKNGPIGYVNGPNSVCIESKSSFLKETIEKLGLKVEVK